MRKNRWIPCAAFGLSAIVLCLGGYSAVSCRNRNPQGSGVPEENFPAECRPGSKGLTARSASPDGKYCVCLVEVPRGISHIDRNFRVRIAKKGDKSSHVIFRSPDEGAPEGTERFAWSRDSKWLLLLGKQFFVKPGVETQKGEYIYLLYDVESGRAYCNATQTTMSGFGFDTLTPLDFEEEFLPKTQEIVGPRTDGVRP